MKMKHYGLILLALVVAWFVWKKQKEEQKTAIDDSNKDQGILGNLTFSYKGAQPV